MSHTQLEQTHRQASQEKSNLVEVVANLEDELSKAKEQIVSLVVQVLEKACRACTNT